MNAQLFQAQLAAALHLPRFTRKAVLTLDARECPVVDVEFYVFAQGPEVRHRRYELKDTAGLTIELAAALNLPPRSYRATVTIEAGQVTVAQTHHWIFSADCERIAACIRKCDLTETILEDARTQLEDVRRRVHQRIDDAAEQAEARTCFEHLHHLHALHMAHFKDAR